MCPACLTAAAILAAKVASAGGLTALAVSKLRPMAQKVRKTSAPTNQEIEIYEPTKHRVR